MIRIVGGTHRSRKLQMPENESIRPTSDKLRQAVFNILEHRLNLHGKRVLDACCGTGAMGLEALSRGAAEAVFMDNDKASIHYARTNAEMLKEAAKCRFLQCSVTAPPIGTPVDLLFLDPPYNKGLAESGLATLTRAGWTGPDTLAFIEVARDEVFTAPEGWTLDNERIHGAAKLLILLRAGA